MAETKFEGNSENVEKQLKTREEKKKGGQGNQRKVGPFRK